MKVHTADSKSISKRSLPLRMDIKVVSLFYLDILNGGNKDWRRLSKESNDFGVSNQAMCADRSPEERDGSGQGN